ncbi:hypothetical protein GCM10010168_85660 [Actinoplanes ianthinogenes]|uniref:DNA-binding phage zinc finger domain-containing protein n=1 Tax=Actinoplanes ianthinogenes TaxID=122358 RepID=A0ABM7M129_9ACTN|nr:hypothetical protein [Actinoplanes ianthinogenes]BCJ45297.1 hypothetical protein Aiant_59540 [Actinoplanes ianthinogenes]GGR53626.1 hypothetical protein GCM10010168_85660 [Actinoplanes ianthinogenes]
MSVSGEHAYRLAVHCPACGAGIGKRCINRIAGRPFLRTDQVHESRRRKAVAPAAER